MCLCQSKSSKENVLSRVFHTIKFSDDPDKFLEIESIPEGWVALCCSSSDPYDEEFAYISLDLGQAEELSQKLSEAVTELKEKLLSD